MNLLLDYFNADWGYVAIFEEDVLTAHFTCEVMSSWVKVPKDNRDKLTYDTIPWIIDTVKSKREHRAGRHCRTARRKQIQTKSCCPRSN